MKATLIVAGAAGVLAASSLIALADDASGTITGIDTAANSITLSDGNHCRQRDERQTNRQQQRRPLHRSLTREPACRSGDTR